MNEYDAKRDYILEHIGGCINKYGFISMGDINGILNKSGWMPSEINPVLNEMIMNGRIPNNKIL